MPENFVKNSKQLWKEQRTIFSTSKWSKHGCQLAKKGRFLIFWSIFDLHALIFPWRHLKKSISRSPTFPTTIWSFLEVGSSKSKSWKCKLRPATHPIWGVCRIGRCGGRGQILGPNSTRKSAYKKWDPQREF